VRRYTVRFELGCGARGFGRVVEPVKPQVQYAHLITGLSEGGLNLDRALQRLHSLLVIAGLPLL
jgi:hypothetical protein